jgi:hypothetical protein
MCVDDTIVVNNDMPLIIDIENIITKVLEMILLGDIHFFFGN